MDKEKVIRKQVLNLLRAGNAHVPVRRAITQYPLTIINRKAEQKGHTPWQLLVHMLKAQDDILEFIKTPDYISPEWPEGYWPPEGHDASKEEWLEVRERFFAGLEVMENYIKDYELDIYAPLPHAENYTVYREAMVLGDHNAYHLGQLMLLKKILK